MTAPGSHQGGPAPDEATQQAPSDPRQIREKIVWRAAVVMLLAVVGWLTYVASEAQERAEALEAELAARQGTAQRLGVSTEQVRRLERAGVEARPERYLLADLGRRGDWLAAQAAPLTAPVELDTERSLVLSDRWVLAAVEGAAAGGTALLAYEIGEDGALSWRLLDYAGE
ncbi:MAG: hypothetical protein ACLFSJ_03400 [Halorhodospira sp.]